MSSINPITDLISEVETTLPDCTARTTLALALRSGQMEAAWNAWRVMCDHLCRTGEVALAHQAEDQGYHLLRRAHDLLAVDDVPPAREELREEGSEHDDALVTLARQEARDGSPCDALWTIKAVRAPLLRAAVRTELLAAHRWAPCACCQATGSVGDWHDAQECRCCDGCGYTPY